MSLKYENNKYNFKKKYILFLSIYYLLTIFLFAYFFYCIGKVFPSHYTSKYSILKNISTSVGNFNTSNNISNEKSTSLEEKLTNFINSAFNSRNNAFLNGNVSKIYNYYSSSESNGSYLLDYEFKRISYLRDWSIERSIIFTSIKSSVIITKITKKDNKLIVDLDEHYSFNYIYNKQVAINKFSLTIPHILTIYINDSDPQNYFYIDKDYYCDIFNDDLDNYTFTLTELTLPYTKRINQNYELSTIYNKDDIIRFDKSLFTDHKAIISGYDSNGYPLIDSNLFNITNMPFDLGWNSKNIKLSY